MIPAPFDYRRASDAEAALALLAEYGDEAKLLAGGHSLLPMMKLRLAAPGLLVDVSGAAGLAYTDTVGGELRIGALTRHHDLAASPLVRAEAPLLAHAAGLVGDPQVRHRGTIGGSLAHADPAADLPAAVLALDATLVLRGPAGERVVAAREFFTGFLDTVLAPTELLVEVRVPRCPGVGWGYRKFSLRGNDWAIVAVATVGGRVALANMGPVPLRAAETERALAAGAGVADAAAVADAGTEPGADLQADADYRRHLARVLTRRALADAAG